MTDGGGPFGFDIIVALLVDDLVRAYQCDAIVETGCYLGDTTEYLARAYPTLPIATCDIWPAHARFTARRLGKAVNVTVTCQDSPELVATVARQYRRPLFFLDAHGGAGGWPLPRELAAASAGIAVIHDFDIGHPRFSHDVYDGVACGPEVLAWLENVPTLYFILEPNARWALPCLQTGRRAGVGVVAINMQTQLLRDHPRLRAHRLPAAAAAA
jgi:hypothetical protein